MTITPDQVRNALEKVLGRTMSMAFLDDDNAAVIGGAVEQASMTHVMVMIRDGMDPTEAYALGSQMTLQVAFALGVNVGREITDSASFVDMMLGIGGFGDAPDAG